MKNDEGSPVGAGPFTTIDRANKVSETETHVFFLNGPFSQWYPSTFRQRLTPDGELLTFNCAEQYMMACKAAMFSDDDVLARIMATHQSEDWRAAHKALGRSVRHFDPVLWNAQARAVVLRGNWAKFTQNDDLAAALLATRGKVLVEGADYDPIWGVGLAWDDPSIVDPANWRGTNWLGDSLVRVRDALEARESFDEWSWRPS